MRFMIQLWSDEHAQPDAGRVAAMAAFNDRLMHAGVLLSAEGLLTSARGARISMANGRQTLRDGPFDDGRAPCVGFWLLRVRSRREALEWARCCPLGDGDMLEVRQLYSPPDLTLTELAAPTLLL